MSIVHRVFNALSESKKYPYVNEMGIPTHMSMWGGLVSSPEFLLATTTAMLQAALAFKATGNAAFAIVPFLGIPGIVALDKKLIHPIRKHRMGEHTFIKKEGMSDPALLTHLMQNNRQSPLAWAINVYLYTVIPQGFYKSFALGKSIDVLDMILFPVLVYESVRNVRAWLRNDMAIKGHWNVQKGQKKIEKKQEVKVPAQGIWQPSLIPIPVPVHTPGRGRR